MLSQKVWERNMKLTMRTETRSRIKLGQGLRVNVQLVVKEMSPNGKYFNIIKRRNRPRLYEARTLKRKLNNGDWVYVSEENQLLVLSDEVARQINSSELIEEEVLNELVENKIMIKSRSEMIISRYLSSLRISYLKAPLS